MHTPNAAGSWLSASSPHLSGEPIGADWMHLIPPTLVFVLLAGPAMATGNAANGQRDFGRCVACHAVQPGLNGIGPSLAAVVGRQSGTEAGYHYSPAMAGAHITWDDASLDKFLTNPQSVVHGTKMFIGVPDAQQRQDIIAYLETLK
jgi:cytochrome c